MIELVLCFVLAGWLAGWLCVFACFWMGWDGKGRGDDL